MRYGKLIVIATCLAPTSAAQSSRSRTQNSETSIALKLLRRAVVTTDRQRRANRDNAKASTGPKTRTGKLHSAQNA